MKIPAVKISQIDRPKNINSGVKQKPKVPDYDRKVELIGREYTVREIRSIYKYCRQTMDKIRDNFEKGV